MDSKAAIYAYLQQHAHMALATADTTGKPEVATVEYVLDGEELLVNTFVHYKKYPNLTENPRVACVVTTGEDRTLQLEGNVQLLAGQEAERAKQCMLAADPAFANFFDDTRTRFFSITPTWMRLRDYTKQPMQVIEYIPDQ